MTPESPAPIPPTAPAPAATPPPTLPNSGSTPAPDVVLPKGADDVVTDVNASLWKYIKKRQMPFVIGGVIVTIIWEVLVFWLLASLFSSHQAPSGNSNQGIGYLIVLPFVVFGAWLSRLKDKFEEAMLEEFANSNGFAFTETGTVDEAYASIFKTQGKQKVSDIVTGDYKGDQMRLFLYQLTVGSGRYRTVHRDTIMELDLKGLMPHLLVANKKAKLAQMGLDTNVGIQFDNVKATTVTLEGDFSQQFTLNCEKGQETEALEIFTPDVMELMEDESRHYSVEIVNNLIYIYSGKYIGTGAELDAMFALARKLIAKLGPVSERMKHDALTSGDGPHQVAATSINLYAAPRSDTSLRKIFKVAIIWVAVMIGVGVLLFAFLMATPAGKSAQNNMNQGLGASPTIQPSAQP